MKNTKGLSGHPTLPHVQMDNQYMLIRKSDVAFLEKQEKKLKLWENELHEKEERVKAVEEKQGKEHKLLEQLKSKLDANEKAKQQQYDVKLKELQTQQLQAATFQQKLEKGLFTFLFFFFFDFYWVCRVISLLSPNQKSIETQMYIRARTVGTTDQRTKRGQSHFVTCFFFPLFSVFVLLIDTMAPFSSQTSTITNGTKEARRTQHSTPKSERELCLSFFLIRIK
ncbi:hypothetical protein RFI_21273 [Reticulomyxa filosa]|uniref:Uncharacterized protein n=1 Tax=Reticulomyxa filosa TaxID=46433 RepID=X6MQ00_RETFI|nr:hypothetical protein RFI_21273 [Reticulomyxa filosa]|eukprot:ETO16083.1 hypothetical protein RFI_21273 [Reticulomyxa filosa]